MVAGRSLAPIEHEGVRYGISILTPARAFDSELPIVMASFQGGSYAVDSRGRLLGKLPAMTPGWKAFRLEPFRVRVDGKYRGWIPKKGNHTLRNPKAHGILTDPAARPAWTEVFTGKDGSPQTREQLLDRFKGRYDANDPAR